LRFVPIDHSGNQSESPEEAERISEIVEQLLREGTTWTNKKGEVAPLLLKDILIVAPTTRRFRHWPKVFLQGPGSEQWTSFRAGGSGCDLFNDHVHACGCPERHGVSLQFEPAQRRHFARACLTVLVASAALFEVQCKTPRQIELANAFCRYLEMAR